MKKMSLFFLFIFCSSIIFAQKECGYVEYIKFLSEKNSDIYQEIKNTEEGLKKHVFKLQENAIPKKARVIPVVVHVLWNKPHENISDEQIASQIQVLNEDFRKIRGTDGYSSHKLAADTMIEFKLAQVDPNWEKTTGITRTKTSVKEFLINDKAKSSKTGGKNAWDTTRYLNLWICNLGGGLLGYAQFPNGNRTLGSDFRGLDSDGVVISYKYFGKYGSAQKPYDMGRTATHEVGHWLGLRHIWGDGGCDEDDGIDDTPPCNAPNYGNPSRRPYSCGHPNMYENYMDYCDDKALNVFTYEQAQRMNATLNLYRFGLCEWDAFGKGISEDGVSGDDFFKNKKNNDESSDDFFKDW